MNDFFDNQRILKLIWERKLHFIVIGVIVVALSAVFSGPAFITPKFKSTARIYPANIEVLSNESETEQMLEIINSRDIKLRMFDAFDLDQVYKIDRNDPYYLTYMLDLYNKNVKTAKTDFETVEIKASDVDPLRASNMCDSIIHFYNKKMDEMRKVQIKELLDYSKIELERKYEELDSLNVALNILKRDYGILDFETQTQEITRGYMSALARGRSGTDDVQKIEDVLDKFTEKGTEAEWLESRLDLMEVSVDTLTLRYERYLGQYEKEISYCQVVENPVPADKKSYPVRWLIVAVSTFSTLFLALLIFLVLDYRKK